MKIGDKVKANTKYPMDWAHEEISIRKHYVIVDILKSKISANQYAQLENIYSSYPLKALKKVSK